MIIPNKAVIEEMGEYSVYLAKDTVIMSSADTTARTAHELKGNHGMFAFQKKVQPGVTIGSNVIIKKGIREGDKVVVDGVQSLHNGSQIASSDQRSSGKTGTQPATK
jgi:membrane fusion protein (multidrug efflux system)